MSSDDINKRKNNKEGRNRTLSASDRARNERKGSRTPRATEPNEMWNAYQEIRRLSLALMDIFPSFLAESYVFLTEWLSSSRESLSFSIIDISVIDADLKLGNATLFRFIDEWYEELVAVTDPLVADLQLLEMALWGDVGTSEKLKKVWLSHIKTSDAADRIAIPLPSNDRKYRNSPQLTARSEETQRRARDVYCYSMINATAKLQEVLFRAVCGPYLMTQSPMCRVVGETGGRETGDTRDQTSERTANSTSDKRTDQQTDQQINTKEARALIFDMLCEYLSDANLLVLSCIADDTNMLVELANRILVDSIDEIRDRFDAFTNNLKDPEVEIRTAVDTRGSHGPSSFPQGISEEDADLLRRVDRAQSWRAQQTDLGQSDLKYAETIRIIIIVECYRLFAILRERIDLSLVYTSRQLLERFGGHFLSVIDTLVLRTDVGELVQLVAAYSQQSHLIQQYHTQDNIPAAVRIAAHARSRSTSAATTSAATSSVSSGEERTGKVSGSGEERTGRMSGSGEERILTGGGKLIVLHDKQQSGERGEGSREGRLEGRREAQGDTFGSEESSDQQRDDMVEAWSDLPI